MRGTMNLLSKAGQQILRCFGEKRQMNPEFGRLQDILSTDTLAKLLPFESFDSDLGLFVNQHSIGFVIEAMPMIGGDEHHQKLLASLFEDFFYENASLQFLLLADHRIQPFLDWWSQGKCEGIFNAVAANRQKHFEKGTFAARNFRFFISYSLPYAGSYVEEAKLLSNTRQRMLKLFQTFTRAHGIGTTNFSGSCRRNAEL